MNIFQKNLPNGEKVERDWLVWSDTAQGLFCFSCCLLKGCSVPEQRESMLSISGSNGGIKDNWRKLYEKIES